MKTFLVAAILAVLIVAGVVVAGADTCKASDISAKRIVELTNQNRTYALVEDSLLAKAAQNKADDMAAKGYFAHTYQSKTGWDFIRQANYKYSFAGENLAVDFSTSEGVVKAWMNSPSHRYNLVNPKFKRIGIGITEGTFQGHRAKFIVQFFSN